MIWRNKQERFWRERALKAEARIVELEARIAELQELHLETGTAWRDELDLIITHAQQLERELNFLKRQGGTKRP